MWRWNSPFLASNSGHDKQYGQKYDKNVIKTRPHEAASYEGHSTGQLTAVKTREVICMKSGEEELDETFQSGEVNPTSSGTRTRTFAGGRLSSNPLRLSCASTKHAEWANVHP